MKKKLLIYAHYYYPDAASTGQILQDLAEGLLDSFDVSVICTIPSYSGKIIEHYKSKDYYIEEINGVKVYRVHVPEFNKASKISRIINLAEYYINAKKITKKIGYHDYILAVSQPPFLGGLLGLYGKNKINNGTNKPKLIYQIQDFNPEQIEAVGYFKNKIIIEFLKFLDKNTCKKADLIITVGRDLVETLKRRFNYNDIPKYVMINNWINDKEVFPLPIDDENVKKFKKEYGLDNKYIIMYSGNIGLYYDLDGLFKVIEKFKNVKTKNNRDVLFAFVGGGSFLDILKKYQIEHDMNNVVFIPYQEKNRLVYSLNAADVHLCVNSKGIKGVSVPSKLYGIMAVAKPVLGIMEDGSEGSYVIKEANCGILCEPMDYDAIEKNIKFLIDNENSDSIINMGKNGRRYLDKCLRMDLSINKYNDALLSL